MTTNYDISVIIPIYGVEKFIARCARSLFNQNMKDRIEFIFVNDCTKDNSIAVLKSVLEEYPERRKQVKILYHEINKGLPQARKTGVQVAKGKYIAHCDSDDWVEPNMYGQMYEMAIKEDADIVCCDYYKADEINKISILAVPNKTLLTGPLWNKIVRSSIYHNNIIDYPIANKAEDGALMVQLSFYAKKISYINYPLYNYFQNPDSICRVMSEDATLKRFEEQKENVELMIKFLEKKDLLGQYVHEVVLWKKNCRDQLLPYYHIKKIRKIWRNTYPEINKEFFFDSQNSIYSKINFMMDYLGLRNYWIQIKKII